MRPQKNLPKSRQKNLLVSENLFFCLSQIGCDLIQTIVLTDVPSDVLKHIFLWLKAREICAVARVCHGFCDDFGYKKPRPYTQLTVMLQRDFGPFEYFEKITDQMTEQQKVRCCLDSLVDPQTIAKYSDGSRSTHIPVPPGALFGYNMLAHRSFGGLLHWSQKSLGSDFDISKVGSEPWCWMMLIINSSSEEEFLPIVRVLMQLDLSLMDHHHAIGLMDTVLRRDWLDVLGVMMSAQTYIFCIGPDVGKQILRRVIAGASWREDDFALFRKCLALTNAHMLFDDWIISVQSYPVWEILWEMLCA